MVMVEMISSNLIIIFIITNISTLFGKPWLLKLSFLQGDVQNPKIPSHKAD